MPNFLKKDTIKCGDCGGEAFTVFHETTDPDDPRVGGQGSGGFGGHLVLKCTSCGDETEVSAVPARLTTRGSACGGWSS